MRAAVIGLPQSGKSTVFTAATGLVPPPGEARRERLGTVRVPEPRLEFLTQLYKSKKVTEAVFEFADIPGFSLADPRGQDELRKHLPAVRKSDVLVAVVRDFEDELVPAHRDRVDAKADLAELWNEFLFADLFTVSNRIEKLEKALSKPTGTHDQEKRELGLLERCRQGLEEGKSLSEIIANPDEARLVSSFAFLTEKPLVVVYNVPEERAAEPVRTPPQHAVATLNLCAKTEAEIAQLDPPDRLAFLADLGLETPARDRLIRACFDALGLIVFLTTGPDETRAWEIRKGTPAREAAGKIHSDLARGFIRAETVAYQDLVEAGDFRSAKAAGKVRQEGKAYVVQDGDVLNIKFNV
ncbi:MAG: redox-regulated ATPase YchF [Planctomycetes bacterium]|nr:redox-regulated ATPase YchF [Planctomycetota bacterium]